LISVKLKLMRERGSMCVYKKKIIDEWESVSQLFDM